MTHMIRISLRGLIVLLISLLASVGCRRDKELSQMQVEVTQAASDLVAQDAAARREIINMQSALDEERRLLNERARQDPIVAEAIMQIGGLILCVLPLFVVARLLRRTESEGEVSVINELVIDELLADQTAATAPKRLDHRDLDGLIRDRIADRRE
jgi:hypothetical protein